MFTNIALAETVILFQGFIFKKSFRRNIFMYKILSVKVENDKS